MNRSLTTIAILILHFSVGYTQSNPAIPKGDILGPFVWNSKIYPGTVRNYWLYLPKQYDATKPACTMVVQDGLSRANGWRLPSVLDSLIAIKDIPVVIGIFIDHGTVSSTGKENYPRFNRSFEYDALGDRYSKFLLDEILPEVSRSYNLSTDPNDRSIAGASSGAICAFNVAWERPNEFRRVLSTIGTYVGLRGGDEFATLVRKTEAKPIRVFLQDGTKDLNIYGGDWWMANQNMLSALTYAGYEVNHAWGEGGGHDSKHSITILADALKWLWKDYPAPVQPHKGLNQRLNLMAEGEAWKEINTNSIKAGKLAVNDKGEVFFADIQSLYKIDNLGNATLFKKLNGEVAGLSFHSDGNLYVGDSRLQKIIAIDAKGVAHDVVSHVTADFLTASSQGLYFTDNSKDRIGFYSFEKKNIHYIAVPYHPTGLAISAEQTFINVGIANHVFGYSLKIMEDGNLDYGQDYVHYHIPYGVTAAGAEGMTVDEENILYSATSMGIQASDQLGRVNFIFSSPGENAIDVKLGGSDLNTLYANFNGKLFTRKINAKGVLSWLPSVKPPKPGM
ncbi:MAG: gluconolactonase [Bacteroidia bacterium]|nr:gluconolactonase [Bacteroidia bacterium]